MNKENLTILCIYDFDGTLIRSEVPETGKPKWKEVTGKDYPHKGWWSKAESLSMDVFRQDPMNQIIEPYAIDSELNNTLMVMLTGRLFKLDKEVKEILDVNNFFFHQYLFNQGKKTIDDKIEQISRLLVENDDLVEVRMYEDRDEHIPIFENYFEALVEGGRLEKFTITKITD